MITKSLNAAQVEVLLNIIDVSVGRGAIRGEEITTVGIIRANLVSLQQHLNDKATQAAMKPATKPKTTKS